MNGTTNDGAITDGPIRSEINGIFVPVSDVWRARAWYRDVLSLPVGEVLFDHLCVIELPGGPDLILDQKLTPDADGAGVQRGGYPLFMFGCDDLEASVAQLRSRGVELLEYGGQVIQNGHWFNMRDCEGNLLMVCA